MACYKVRVKGRVQGVFFRQTSKRVARENNITGWVRNTEEGDVEALICGAEDDLQKFIEWCRVGPEDAVVEDVVVAKEVEQVFEEFEVRRGR